MNDSIIRHNVRIVMSDANFKMEEFHTHDHYEIIYIIKGKRKVYTEEKAYTAKEGEMILFRKNMEHRTAAGNESVYKRIILYFNDNYLKREGFAISEIFDFFQRKHCITAGIEIQNIMKNMVFEYENFNRYSNHLLNNYLYELIVDFSRKNMFEESAVMANGIVARALDYIDGNFNTSISLERLAEICNINKFYLSRIFKKVTGSTVVQYINSLRIQKSMEMLSSSEKTITEICYENGFSDIRYFSYIFKEYVGLTPRDYRKIKYVSIKRDDEKIDTVEGFECD